MKKKNLLFVAIGLLIGLFSGFKVANSNYRKEVKENRDRGAASAINSTNPAKKTGEVEAAIAKARSNPGDHKAQLDAAEQFLEVQRPEGAVEFLNRALEIKPNDAETLAGLGEVYYLQQKFDEAINYSRRALKEKPGLPIATFYLMASLVETRQNLDEAEQLLSQLEQLRPGDRALQQVREVIRSTRAGQSSAGPSAGVSGTKSVEKGQQGQAGKTGKTVLAHGPEESGKKPR